MKIAKDPLMFISESLNEFSSIPFSELDSNKEGKDDLDHRLKWLGLFHRRKKQCKVPFSE